MSVILKGISAVEGTDITKVKIEYLKKQYNILVPVAFSKDDVPATIASKKYDAIVEAIHKKVGEVDNA